MVQFDADAALHHRLHCSELVRLAAGAGTEVRTRSRLRLRVGLLADSRASVVSLVAIGPPFVLAGAAGLGQCPPGEVLVLRRESAVLWRVAAGPDRCRSRGVVLKSSAAFDAEREFLRRLVDRLLRRQVLRARAGVGRASLETRLSADLGSAAAGLAGVVRLSRLVEEQCILVEVVPRLVLANTNLGTERPGGGLIVFDLVLEGVCGPGGDLTGNISLRHLGSLVELLTGVAVRLRHTVGGGRTFD